MNRRSVLVLLLAIGAWAPACQEKVPYPTTRSPSPAVPPAGLGREGARLASPADPGRPSGGDEEASPAAGQPAPLRPVAIVRTPDGSLVLSSRPGGADLATRRLSGWAWLGEGGVASLARVTTESPRAAPGAPESRFVHLRVRTGGAESEVPLADLAERPDLASAVAADPDLAKTFYHRESLAAVGALESRLALVLAVEGFLGGAHPYASRRLLVLDQVTGRLEDLTARFAGRDLAAEVLGDGRETSCVRRPAGVGPVEGRGGEPVWVLGLAHDVESCAGDFRLARVPGAVPDTVRPVPAVAPGSDGSLRLAEGLAVSPVADWRVSAAGGAAVLLMGADRGDRAAAPWETSRRNGSTRELRWWEPGLPAPAVLGRTRSLLAVQFLDGAGESAGEAAATALDRL